MGGEEEEEEEEETRGTIGVRGISHRGGGGISLISASWKTNVDVHVHNYINHKSYICYVESAFMQFINKPQCLCTSCAHKGSR